MHWTVLLLFLNHQNRAFVSQNGLSSRHFVRELQWNLFQVTHAKQYPSHEEQFKRKSIFFATLNEIQRHNKRYYRGLETFKMGINQFSDVTDEEFGEMYPENGVLGDFDGINMTVSNFTRTITDKEVNWYTSKIPVKDQGKCGACWTFATTGLLEYDYFIKAKEVVSLSEQELLDCTPKDNYGCNGGIPYYALEFVKESGINYENDYPYKTRQTKCNIKNRKAPKLVQNVQMTPRSEKAIHEHLFYSPVIVGVHYNKKAWKNYESDYISAQKCTKGKINHAILILGVVKEKGKKLWYARNSFGHKWGINGHLKLEMDKNTCGISTQPGFFVTV